MKSDTSRDDYSAATRFLIIHADDLGMAHSVNKAAFDAFEAGAISSASVMVPCPCFTEVVDYAKKHKGIDLGVHLTITSEWSNSKWKSISGKEHVPGLVDSFGFFWPHTDNFRAPPNELEMELRAQISQAYQAGMTPTHIDAHMFSVLTESQYAAAYVKVAREYQLPFLSPCITPVFAKFFPAAQDLLSQTNLTANVYLLTPGIRPDQWLEYYIEMLWNLPPGLNELIVHPAYDTDELRTITAGCEAWGSSWRQRDFDVLMNPKFRAACRDKNIQIINWKTALQLDILRKTA
jgi:predicted glycoside hydrolase/deacetylase ChbG (UPF0249 family)